MQSKLGKEFMVTVTITDVSDLKIPSFLQRQYRVIILDISDCLKRVRVKNNNVNFNKEDAFMDKKRSEDNATRTGVNATRMGVNESGVGINESRMDKDEILKRSREENKKGDERVRLIGNKSTAWGCIAGFIILFVGGIIEMMATDGKLYLESSVIFMTTGVMWTHWGASQRKKWYTVFGIFCIVWAAFHFFMHLGSIFIE